ncbi:hypothetical protein LUZ61_017365 [Rhynchospora tenuis]|uniref:F-box domain-containing protein n=1 Tax=Rhynchospora tenuis TaxID=198213 RepID=A0AAD6EKX6_9POAL|nr:hypothetical protein LUZ61_017365 [Rhynchospora tenuis]
MQRENSDRISNLPDSLLTHILSLLDTRVAAQTCILSKRWHNLWTFVPSLCFNFFEFSGDAERFNNFVSSFLRLRDGASSLHAFQLDYYWACTSATETYVSIVRTWIVYALEHKVKCLRITLPVTSTIPDCVFICDSLEELHLNFVSWKITETDIVCLPKLRKLVLLNLFIPEYFIKIILSGSPSLETLGLLGCTIESHSISLHSVKSLSIVQCKYINQSLPLSISAPCLEYLMLSHHWSNIVLKDISKLTKVKIFSADNFDFLSEISGCQVLEISIDNLISLQRKPKKCSTYYNLKHLTIDSMCTYCHFPAWSSFLKYCPNLTSLCLEHSDDYCQVEDGCNNEEEHQIMWQDKQFPCQRLKTIEIINSGHNQKSLEHLQQLLLEWANQTKGLQIILSERSLSHFALFF